MNHGIVIIGSGFAARQLVKNIRKQDTSVPLTLIAGDSMDEYSKPELSHVVSQGQSACDLTRQSAEDFAEQFNLRLFPHTWVTDIDADAHLVKSQDGQWQYDKLVLATGASAFVPPVEGCDLMITLNSQQAYQAHEPALRGARRVLIVGAGLIGTELAMDFCRAGKEVSLIDNAPSILSALMPAEVSSRLQHRLTDIGVHLLLKSQLQSLEQTQDGVRAVFDRDRSLDVDVVVAAVGLRPELALAQRAGAEVQRGVKVDSHLQTTRPDIYALGDCAEINGQVLPFLQPIQLSALNLAKNLLGGDAPLKLPAMLVKVKTPEMPLHLGGEMQRRDLHWQIALEPQQGMVARGLDAEGQLRAFVVSEARMKEAFALLKSLAA